jgi:hypothetical protein|tara:strand:+ start:868 stop:1080 length:213 start_codon:yes stop_codon:yes gene_type:complete
MTLGLTEMPTIKEIKLILANVRGFTLKKEKREEVPRPSPLPPKSPFSDAKVFQDIPLTEDIVKKMRRAGY